jgi:hypothetical protein
LKEPPGDEDFEDVEVVDNAFQSTEQLTEEELYEDFVNENTGEEKEDADKTLTDEFLGDAELFVNDQQEADATVLDLLGQRMGR